MESVNDIFGCDIGNGFCYISVLEKSESDPKEMLPAKLSENGMPSVAYITPPDGTKIEVYNGNSALEKHRKRNPERLVHAVKTRLKEEVISIDSMGVSTDAIYAAIARDLIILGNKQRESIGKSPIYDVVFAFPAVYTDDLPVLNRMEKSISNLVIDGNKINVIARLPEPAAVAIDYLYYMQNIAPKNIRLKSDSFTVLVYDLGHGTFDTAVVTARSQGEPYQLHIKDGLANVGGKNFDEAIYNELCGVLNAKYNVVPRNENDKESIRNLAVNIKHNLTGSDSCVENIGIDGGYYEVEFTRERFEEIIEDLILQTMEMVANVVDEARRKNISIDAVVLSGGASQMPIVKEQLNDLLKGENIPIRTYRPSKAVSFGAARYAKGFNKADTVSKPTPKLVLESTSNTILEQMADYSYGFLLPSSDRLEGEVSVLIKGDEKLPAVSSKMKLRTESGSVVLRLYRSLEKGVFDRIVDVENMAQSIMRIPFELPRNSDFDVSIVVQEDYNVRVICVSEDGKIFQKSTSDTLGVLYSRRS